MARLVVVSFRLGGHDGVSVEAAKWIGAFRTLGHDVTTLAGEGGADVVMPELAMHAAHAPRPKALARLLDDADLVVVENMASLALNVGARDALYEVLVDRAALFHHHDLAWQRDGYTDEPAPRDGPRWAHVTINDLSREQLRERGVEAVTIRNAFDCAPALGRRDETRAALHVTSERLVLMPTRAIERKNVAGALDLAKSLDAVLWLLGPAEDGYDERLARLLATSPVRVLRGLPEGYDVDDAYGACDVVTLPSFWEGFGNPALESVTHRRALAVYPYPVLAEIRAFGFRFFDLADAAGLAACLEGGDETLFEDNLAIARSHFNLADLPARLAPLLEAVGIG